MKSSRKAQYFAFRSTKKLCIMFIFHRVWSDVRNNIDFFFSVNELYDSEQDSNIIIQSKSNLLQILSK